MTGLRLWPLRHSNIFVRSYSKAAVDRDSLSCDPGRQIRGKENDCVRDILRSTEAPKRMHGHQASFFLWIDQESVDQRCASESGTQAVHSNLEARIVKRRIPRQGYNGAL